MKTRIFFSLFFVATFFIGLFFSGCSKTDSTATVHNYISTYAKNEILYTGKDTLTFVRTTSGDTFNFYGGGWQSGTNNSIYLMTDYYQKSINEFRKITFQSPTFLSSIVIYQSAFDNYEQAATEFYISFQNTGYNNRFSDFLEINKDSMIISKKTFYKVYTLTNPSISSTMFYYNVQYGILRMSLSNGETWELIPKK